jgi:hypothetical protein
MGTVTFHAGRHLVGFLFPQLAADDLDMGSLDVGMALHTGLDHILTADRGVGIGMRQNIVVGMAAGTNGGHGQSLAEKALAVNGHRIMFQDIMFRNIMGLGHGAPFLMTAAAHEGNVQYIGPGSFVRGRQNIMFAMTGTAIRGKRIVVGHCLTVQTVGIDLSDIIVAIAAID